MAADAKPSSSSCISFLKDALLLPTKNPKLFVPVFVLVAIPTCLVQLTNLLGIQPLATHILALLDKMKNMDPSTDEFARLMEKIRKDVREVVIISIALFITALILNFAKQIIVFFAASTTYSGDRYSFSEIISKVSLKGHCLKGPFITIALVSVLEFACVRPAPFRTAPARDTALGGIRRGGPLRVPVRGLPLP